MATESANFVQLDIFSSLGDGRTHEAIVQTTLALTARLMSPLGTKLPKLVGQSMSALPGNSDIDLFRYGQGVIDLDAEVSDGAFDLGVTEQELHRPQVTSAPVDQGRFGPSE
jgi:hypothetical protein